MKQKERKNIGNILNYIGKTSSFVAKSICLIGLTGVVLLAITYRGESIKIPKGATLSQLAEQYETSQQRLIEVNELEDPDYIQTGQDLIIYNRSPLGFRQMVYDRINNWF